MCRSRGGCLQSPIIGGNMINQDTLIVQKNNQEEIDVKEVLKTVYNALKEKGYNPVNQIVGYVLSGDPTYVTSFNNARTLITKVERDEIIEELVSSYIKNTYEK